MPTPLWTHDRKLAAEHEWLIGVDEAGRGALAGPVTAAACVVHRDFFAARSVREVCSGIQDSKQLTTAARERQMAAIQRLQQKGALDFRHASGGVDEINQLNILGASRLAMERALRSFHTDGAATAWRLESEVEAEAGGSQLDIFERPEKPYWQTIDDRPTAALLVDGRPLKPFPWRHRAMIDGDALSLVIAMASIIAKVTRDREMTRLCADYPAYRFSQHKGYGTAEHRAALRRYGPCRLHRPLFLRNLELSQRTGGL